uniref:CSON000254 protein n=1 Tax=Culicoides sonorensis TaxID=179676 RepID=A0A336MIA9_CULSO
MYFTRFLAALVILIATSIVLGASDQPHIIFILADDLGFNDVSFHGSSQIPTPNIDALAYSGIILNRYYVTPLCTPSRAALMTGKYAIRTGMQHTVIYGMEPRGLPLNETILPQYLNQLGYQSHILGKWHLGHFKRVYTPLYRGFDSHVGYWTGHQDYYDHTAEESGVWGLDMRRGLDVARDLHGKYTTDIVTEEAVHLIKNHNETKPLFLYLAHVAVHSGNPYNPLPAPDEVVAEMSHIEDYKRRRFAAVLTKLDRSVGEVVKALHDTNMLKNSIIIFSTDNGGPAAGFNINAASNWPLRGVKNTLWEGGVRGAGLIWSPLLEQRERVSNQLMHITDWLPTLYSAAGGDVSTLKDLDGLDLWPALSKNQNSPRNEALINIDDIWDSHGMVVGDYKVVKGTNYHGAWDNWYGPAGNRDPKSYNVENVHKSHAGSALHSLGLLPDDNKIRELRLNADINCSNITSTSHCNPLEAPCLFNVVSDPCERHNLAKLYPTILNAILDRLKYHNSTALPPNNVPTDPRGDPRLWDYTWTNFDDYHLIEMEKEGITVIEALE